MNFVFLFIATLLQLRRLMITLVGSIVSEVNKTVFFL